VSLPLRQLDANAFRVLLELVVTARQVREGGTWRERGTMPLVGEADDLVSVRGGDSPLFTVPAAD